MDNFDKIVKSVGGGKKDPASKKDSDPLGYVEFAKNTGPSHVPLKEPEYTEEDKGYEAEVFYAKTHAGPEQPQNEATAQEKVPGRAGQGKEIGSRGSRTERPPVPSQQGQRAARQERGGQPNETERLREQLVRAENAYAQAYAVAKSRMGLIRRTLGIENVENDPEVCRARQTYVAAREAFNNFNVTRLQERLRNGEINETQFNQEAQNLLADIFVNHDLSLQNKKMQFRQAEDLRRGTFAGRVEAWWNRAIDGYRKLPLWAKVGTSLGLFALGGGTVAISGMMAMRILGGGATAKGTQELLQSVADRWRKRTGGLRAGERLLGLEQTSPEYRAGALQDLINNYHGDMNQRFVRMERGDIARRWTGFATGLLMGSGTISGYIRDTIGDWWTGGKGGTVAPEGPGKGALAPDKIETRPHGHVINQGDNIWKVTRDIYMENPKGYEYDANDPKIQKLFQSFKRQGILERMNIDADSFSDLTDEEKVKIWAENRTANSVNKITQMQGGRIKDLVHAGDTVTLKPDGSIVFNEASGIKAGYLGQGAEPSAGKSAIDTPGRSGDVRGGGVVDTSQFDQKIEDARARGTAAEAFGKGEVARLGAESQALDAQASARFVNASLSQWDRWLEQGVGNGFKPSTPARDVWEGIRNLALDVTSDQPLPPTGGEMIRRNNVLKYFQEVFRVFPPQGQETMRHYLERMTQMEFSDVKYGGKKINLSVDTFFNHLKERYHL